MIIGEVESLFFRWSLVSGTPVGGFQQGLLGSISCKAINGDVFDAPCAMSLQSRVSAY